MRAWNLPGVLVAAPFVGGAALAVAWLDARPVLAVALAGLSLALGGRAGRPLTLLAAGLAAGWVGCGEGGELPARLDAARPVEVRGCVEGPWRRGHFGWSGSVRIETIRQASRVVPWRASLRVYLPDTEPSTAERLRLKGFLRRTAGLANDPPLAPGPWQLRVKSARFVEGLPEVRPCTGSMPGWSRRLGAAVERAVDSAGDPTAGTRLARALLLGDSSRLEPRLLRGLRRTGLGHLLAVSGLHVGILAIVLWLTVGHCLPRRFRDAVPVLGAILYVLLVGARPAILRAAVMALLAVSSLRAERPPQSLNALGWALAAIVAVDPRAVAQMSFALTASATAGLVVLTPVLARRWRRLPTWLARPLAASVGAQVGALPWTVSLFHSVSPIGTLLNLLAVPWTAVALATSMLWAALCAFAPSWQAPIRIVLDTIARPYSWCAELPPWPVVVQPAALGWLGASSLTVLVSFVLLGRGARARGVAAALAVLLFTGPRPSANTANTEVVMLDVGQGDAILLRDGSHAVLVDGGGWHRRDIAQAVLVPALARLGVRRLDAMVSTHPDLDHCGGLVQLAAYLPVREVWSAPGRGGAACAGDLITLSGAVWKPLWRGRSAAMGRWSFEVLHPPPVAMANVRVLGKGSENDRSLVLRATAGGRSILLTGDLEAAGERRLLRSLPAEALQAAVLKVAHHGSHSSTTEPFLAAVDPVLALVSAGRGNNYGHPARRVVERLERRRIRILRTDRDGMIRLPWPPADAG